MVKWELGVSSKGRRVENVRGIEEFVTSNHSWLSDEIVIWREG